MNIPPVFVAAALSALATGHLYATDPVITWSRIYDSGSANNVVSVYQRATGVDGAGNVFVLGRTDSEWAVVKYLPDGSSSWINRFRGSVTGSASGYDLAVDTAGNVHVTGYYSAPDFSGGRLVTVKYLPDGTAAWTNYFAGIGYGVALDEGGNVYVAGSSGAFGTGADFITLKYRSDGTAVWTNRYNGPGPSANDADDVATLVVDGAGSVVVTGTSQRPGGGSDFATVKYQTDGTPVWTNRYGEAGFTFASASDLTVDVSGDVYVTGGSREGSGDTSDYVTIKYHADGTPLWTNRFNSLGNGRDFARSVKVDNVGDVYVRGSSVGKNHTVVKYNSAGAALWTNVFKGTYSTEGEGLALDGDGNVFMAAGIVGNGTGPDIAVIQYLSNGTAVRTNRFIGQGDAIDTATSLAVDHLGNVFLAASSTILGLSSVRSLLVRYPANETPGWTNFFGIPVPGNDQVTKAVADAAGNIYVIGETWGYGTASDYLTIKFQADGTPVWTNRYDAPSHNLDDVRDIAVDSAGNVYVTGDSRYNLDDSDYLTIKYLADGTPAWTNRFNPTHSDHVSGVVVDHAGNVYVTGTTGEGDDAVTIKYRSDGTTAWIGRYRGGDHGAYAYAIAVDSVGSIYVAGQDHSNGDYQSWFVIKYQSNGLTLWTNRFSSGRGDDAYAIAVDEADNVSVTGVSSSSSDADYLTIKYRPDGTAVWTNHYNGPASGGDLARAIKADNAGNVYVTGLSGLTNYSNAGADYATVEYHSDGTPAWTNRYDGLGNSFDVAEGLAIDAKGNMYVTGRSTGAGTGLDHATIKYRSDGTPVWTNRVSGSSSDSAVSVISLASGDVVVAGTIGNADGSSDWFLYRLAEPPELNQVSLALLPDLGVRLRFTGVSCQAYQVQRASSVNGPWAVLSTLTAPAHGMIEYMDSNRSLEGAFYRTATP